MKNHLLRKALRLAAAAALALAAGALHAQTALPREVTIGGVEFVLIPAGWFYKTGGQPRPGEAFEPLANNGGGNVRVWLDDYYMAKYEARARDFVAFLNSPAARGLTYAGSHISCSTRQGDDGKYFQLRPDEDLPATHLSWDLADRWARWMGFRLATEMEWEKAARGTDQRTWPWGDEYPDDTYAGYKTTSDCHTWPVNSFLKGRSPYGIHNMAGNVREFVADWYSLENDRALEDGARNPAPAPAGTTRPELAGLEYPGPWKMLKGGRWASHEHQLQIDARIYYDPASPFRCNGTRFALDAAAVREHLARGTATVTAP
jgi:formylglycine-generating enzyme required for sulfatase activity